MQTALDPALHDVIHDAVHEQFYMMVSERELKEKQLSDDIQALKLELQALKSASAASPRTGDGARAPLPPAPLPPAAGAPAGELSAEGTAELARTLRQEVDHLSASVEELSRECREAVGAVVARLKDLESETGNLRNRCNEEISIDLDKLKKACSGFDEIAAKADYASHRVNVLEAEKEEAKVALYDEEPPEEKPDAMQKTDTAAIFAELEADEYEITESIWDVAPFIGLKALGCGGSLMTFLVLLINVFMQAAFCMIILNNLAQESFGEEDLEGLKSWRMSTAHDARNLNTITMTTLASRVCGEDGALSVSTNQAIALEEVRRYLPGEGLLDATMAASGRRLKAKGLGGAAAAGALGDESSSLASYFPGYLMCMLALACWYIVIGKEVYNILRFGRAFFGVQHKLRSRILEEEDGIRFVSMSPARRVGGLFVVVVRLSIVAALIYGGTKYLVYTMTYEDMLLNALALEFVINLDEFLFESLGPIVAKRFVAKLQPLPMKPWPHIRGADCMSLLLPILVIVGIWITYARQLETHIDNLRQAQKIICGGNTDFLFATNEVNMTFIIENLSPFSEKPDTDNIKSKAIKEVIDGVPPEKRKYALSIMDNDYPLFLAFTSSSTGVDKIAEMLQDPYHDDGCIDIFEDFAPEGGEYNGSAHFPEEIRNNSGLRLFNKNFLSAFPTYMGYAIKKPPLDLRSCADVEKICYLDTAAKVARGPNATDEEEASVEDIFTLATFARLVCPMTCGCASPGSGSMIFSAQMGCARGCTEKIRESLRISEDDEVDADETCEDVDKAAPSTKRALAWKRWKKEMAVIAPDLAAGVEVHGCNTVSFLPELCAADVSQPVHGSWKAWNYFCPRACGCPKRGVGPNPEVQCPSSCICKWTLPDLIFPDASIVASIPETEEAPCEISAEGFEDMFSHPPNSMNGEAFMSARCCFIGNTLLQLVAEGSKDPSKFLPGVDDAFTMKFGLTCNELNRPCRSTCLPSLQAVHFPMLNRTLGDFNILGDDVCLR
eukprot:TRINITY_DN30384_c0_g1_i1.p1 TRINITY_DN30384_c0_g1~~TRINITY_DN30384_c0_g1_i1.p1  ORF type:complete len:1011 (+),score=159.48 TRINITY_DN30384_c0_g1_i1:156-3188(+)